MSEREGGEPRAREEASEEAVEGAAAAAAAGGGEGSPSPSCSLRQSIALCTAPRSSIAFATAGSWDRLTSAASAGRREEEEGASGLPSPASSAALRSSGGVARQPLDEPAGLKPHLGPVRVAEEVNELVELVYLFLVVLLLLLLLLLLFGAGGGFVFRRRRRRC